MDGSGYFLHRKVGVTQGVSPDTIFYGIGILPLIRELCNMTLQVMHTWYADDTGSGGNFSDIQVHLEALMMCGPP